jgi:uncharacterized membrane protein YheB (UPF0754 family)
MNMFFSIILISALSFGLSDEEKKGLCYCTETDVVLTVVQESQFITIIFAHKAPIYFRKSELSADLLKKISNIVGEEKYKISCVQAFWRDDWQEVYNRYKEVTNKLLDIEKTRP